MVNKPKQVNGSKNKLIDWRGSSFKDLTDEKIFSLNAKREAGYQLRQVQRGSEPDHWKPFNQVGSGANEIIIDFEDGWYRVMYVAKFEEAIYVLHCFKKKTNKTSKKDIEIAIRRYKDVILEREE
jgi:phage-related protein